MSAPLDQIEPQAAVPPSIARAALSPAQQWRIVLIAGAAAITLGFLFVGAPHLWSRRTHRDAPAADNSFPVSEAGKAGFTIAPVALRSFHDTLRTDGRIALNADATTAVYSPYTGRVTRLVAEIGERVRQGAPLLEIEATEYAQALADLATSGAQRRNAHLIEARRHAAYDAQGASLQDWQQSQADAAAADASYETARNRLLIFGRSDAEVDELERRGSRAATAAVVSPIGGVVIDRQVGPGEYVQAGASTPVYTVGNLDTVWVVANVREIDAVHLRVGDPVEIHVLALPDRTFTARIAWVASAVDPATRRVAARAVLENPGNTLRPEMFATIDIATGPVANAIAVPEEAVVREGDAARVWLVHGNRVELRSVQLGRSADGMLEIRAGLAAGERVVTSGSLFIDRAAGGE